MKEQRKKIRSDTISFAEIIRKRIESSGEKIWRYADFENMPLTAVAKALSRLFRQGMIQRIGKGLYYRPRQSIFGQSKPNISQLRSLPIQKRGIFPAGNAAANILGFSTQNAAKIEVATNGLSLPRLIIGKDTIIHTRRPDSWQELSYKDGAILDFLRKRGESSELTPETTVKKLIEHCKESGQFDRLFHVALSEPPRVRAMLGSIGQEIGYSQSSLLILRKSLNPLSRFDFGKLISLKHAKEWQAKDHKIL